MIAPFDVFRLTEGVPIWCAAAQTFEDAEKKAKILAESDRCDHIIFDQSTGSRVMIEHDASTPK
jgi:hypothetical protein